MKAADAFAGTRWLELREVQVATVGEGHGPHQDVLPQCLGAHQRELWGGSLGTPGTRPMPHTARTGFFQEMPSLLRIGSF